MKTIIFLLFPILLIFLLLLLQPPPCASSSLSSLFYNLTYRLTEKNQCVVEWCLGHGFFNEGALQEDRCTSASSLVTLRPPFPQHTPTKPNKQVIQE